MTHGKTKTMESQQPREAKNLQKPRSSVSQWPVNSTTLERQQLREANICRKPRATETNSKAFSRDTESQESRKASNFGKLTAMRSQWLRKGLNHRKPKATKSLQSQNQWPRRAHNHKTKGHEELTIRKPKATKSSQPQKAKEHEELSTTESYITPRTNNFEMPTSTVSCQLRKASNDGNSAAMESQQSREAAISAKNINP